jgi:iron complex outermembrane receptor protein
LAACVLVGMVRGQRALEPLSARQLKQMSVEELLQQEVVSVSRRGESLGAAAANVFYIDSGSDRSSGATTLPEMLRLAPSLFVAQSSSYHWGVNARGFMRTNGHSNKLLVLLDGRTVYSPLFSNVFWDSTDVFLPDLESIEVISGPSGSNWGSNAVNGVINVQSKSARETLGGLVQVSGGSNGSQLAVREGFRAGDGAVRIYAKRTDREATLSATGADDGQDAWHTTQAGFRGDWGSAATGQLTVQGDWLSGVYDAKPSPAIRNDGGNLLARWAQALSPDSEFWVRAYYDYVMRDSSGFLTETTRTRDVEFQHALKLTESQHFLWGANYRHINDNADDPVGFAILPAHLGMNLYAIFAQHDVTWADDAFRLTTGLRFEHNDFTGWEYQPTVRLSWQMPGHTVWIASARATRTPSRLDKDFFIPATPPYVIIGGPDFTSEILHSYELGWRGELARTAALTATLYYHGYDDLRTVEPTTPIVEANGAMGRSYGLELFLDYDVTPRWRLRFGGFVMNQENRLKPGSADTEHGWGEASFPGHQVFLRNTFRLTDQIELWLALRHIAEVPTYENGNGIVPAYTELDARLGWQVRPNLNVALVGRNLLNPSHPEIGGVTARREIPRSLSVSVRFEY